MRLQSAIFDMDGTLLDSMPMWGTVAADLVRGCGAEPEPDLNERLKVLSSRQSAEYCRTRYHLAPSVEELMARIYAAVEGFYRQRVEAKAGVDRFLSLLKMEGVWMYVATATERQLTEDALAHAGLRDYFRGVITCGEAGRGKDDPLIYEMALRRLQSTKKDTVVFEDSLVALRTAKAAGFRVAGVYDASEPDQAAMEAEADYYIRSFADWTAIETG